MNRAFQAAEGGNFAGLLGYFVGTMRQHFPFLLLADVGAKSRCNLNFQYDGVYSPITIRILDSEKHDSLPQPGPNSLMVGFQNVPDKATEALGFYHADIAAIQPLKIGVPLNEHDKNWQYYRFTEFAQIDAFLKSL